MKIGFLALSGIRVIDPELRTIGLNLPGFVERSKVIASLPSLGMLTLAGLTPARHEVRYLDIHEDDPFDEEQFAAWVKQASQLPGERM